MGKELWCNIDSKKSTYKIACDSKKCEKKKLPYDDGYPSCTGLKQAVDAGVSFSGGTAPQNPWIQHVKAFAKNNDLKYSDALKSDACRKAYYN